MDIKHIEGKKKGKVMLYALSTCVWCKKTKRLLNQLGVDYSYVDVDLASPEDKEQINSVVLRWNPSGSYPTIVIDEKQSIAGYDPDKIKEVLGNGE
ncbi:MAG: glutaredoxin family protein [candidate division WOR-3 bacterium]|nr:MAG: glutaredoxin family protein [candidate division WOR-3 bacterium]